MTKKPDKSETNNESNVEMLKSKKFPFFLIKVFHIYVLRILVLLHALFMLFVCGRTREKKSRFIVRTNQSNWNALKMLKRKDKSAQTRSIRLKFIIFFFALFRVFAKFECKNFKWNEMKHAFESSILCNESEFPTYPRPTTARAATRNNLNWTFVDGSSSNSDGIAATVRCVSVCFSVFSLFIPFFIFNLVREWATKCSARNRVQFFSFFVCKLCKCAYGRSTNKAKGKKIPKTSKSFTQK